VVVLPDVGRGKLVQTVLRFLCNKRIIAQSDAFRAGLVGW